MSPSITHAGWANHQSRSEYCFTDKWNTIHGNLAARRKNKCPDYLLFHKPNMPIAIIEVTDNSRSSHNETSIATADCASL